MNPFSLMKICISSSPLAMSTSTPTLMRLPQSQVSLSLPLSVSLCLSLFVCLSLLTSRPLLLLGTLVMAMGLGLPCLSTPYPFAKEMFQDHSGGILVPFRDSAAMSRGLEYLLDDESRAREIGRRGRAKTSPWDEVAKKYLELIYAPPLPQSKKTAAAADWVIEGRRGRPRSSPPHQEK
jgi:hypothetical protein